MSDSSPSRRFHRIHIIGGPGSGKTALAGLLSSSLGIPVYRLDDVAFEGNNFVKRPLTMRVAAVRAIAGQPVWISEGIFLGWTEELLQSADTIVWIDDVYWLTAAWRITRRFALGGLRELQRQNGLKKISRFNDYARNLRQLISVLGSTREYYTLEEISQTTGEPQETSRATCLALRPYSDKVVHCRRASDVKTLLETIALAPPVLKMSESRASAEP